MQRISHWSLVALISLNLTWGHDWLQLPGLWVHYQHHVQESSGAIGLSDFLALHYSDARHHGSDSSHDGLPFQHHHHGGAMDPCNVKVLGHEPIRSVSFPDLFWEKDLSLPADDDPLTGHFSELLRPPQRRA